VDGDSEGFFSLFLADAMKVEVPLDFRGFWDLLNRSGLSGIGGEFFVEDVFAKDNTVIADVNAGTGDQFFYFGVGFAAKAAEGQVSRSSHE